MQVNERMRRNKKPSNREISVIDFSRRSAVAGLLAAMPLALLAKPIRPSATNSTKLISDAATSFTSISFDKSDATTFLQSLINNATHASTVAQIPAGRYLINTDTGLALPSGARVVLSDDTYLVGTPSDKSNYSLIRIFDAKNVSLKGGHIVGERNKHLGHGGEWGMGVDIRGSTNVTVTDTTASNCWGDGIYVGLGPKNHLPCRNVILESVTSINNRRQGLSIVSCIGAKVLNSTFRGTNGTPPQAGIDLEPDGNDPLSDITIRNCNMIDNTGAGIQTANHVSNVLVDNCNIRGNHGNGIMLLGKTTGVVIASTSISNARGASIYVGEKATAPVMRNNTLAPGLFARKLKIVR
jgi:hypothetical protein